MRPGPDSLQVSMSAQSAADSSGLCQYAACKQGLRNTLKPDSSSHAAIIPFIRRFDKFSNLHVFGNLLFVVCPIAETNKYIAGMEWIGDVAMVWQDSSLL